jgi:hypothetical protein
MSSRAPVPETTHATTGQPRSWAARGGVQRRQCDEPAQVDDDEERHHGPDEDGVLRDAFEHHDASGGQARGREHGENEDDVERPGRDEGGSPDAPQATPLVANHVVLPACRVPVCQRRGFTLQSY